MRIRMPRLILAIAATVMFASDANAQQSGCRNCYRSVSHARSHAGGEECAGCEAEEEDPCAEEEEEDDSFRLFDFPCLAEKNIAIGGWLAQSITFNFDDPVNRFNGPVTFNDRSNEYQLNQFNLFVEKTLDTECGWDWGGRIDVLYGTDYRFITASGLEDDINGLGVSGNGNFYGLALPQFYGVLGNADVNFKVGHFYSPVGYAVPQATGNFFVTMPYTFQYGEPFTHTGAIATVTSNESLTWFAGITRGWDNFDNSGNSHAGFLGGATLTAESGVTFAMVNVWSQERTAAVAAGAPANVDASRYLQTNVLTVPLSDELTYVVQSDFGFQVDTAGPGTPSAEWYGVNQYLFYTINDCWAFGMQFEWFRDDDGTRVGAALPSVPGFPFGSPNARGVPLPFGFAGNFYQVAAGFKWTPTTNITVRPNLRYDWYNGVLPGGNKPYGDFDESYQWLFVTDLVYTF